MFIGEYILTMRKSQAVYYSLKRMSMIQAKLGRYRHSLFVNIIPEPDM